MNSSIEKLAKYIQLEADRGFDNRAVMGGLERMLEPWEQEARQSGLPDAIVDAVVSRLRDYGGLSGTSRQEALRGLWTRLRSQEEALGPFPQPAAAKPAQQEAGEGQPAEEPGPTGPSADSTPSGEPQEGSSIPTGQPTPPNEKGEGTSQPEPEVPEPAPTEAPAAMSAPLTTIAGIGPKSAKTLRKLGLETLGDLLWHLPRRYDDYSQLKTINRLWYGEEVTIIATVDEIRVRPVRAGKMKLVEAKVSDGTGTLRITWFNQAWIAGKLKPGSAVVLSGKVDQYLGHLTMNSPEWEPLEREQLHTNRIVPVYPLTAGITSKWMRRVMHSVVVRLAPRLPDPIPDTIRGDANLMPLGEAVVQVHFPDNWEILRRAQQRLAFDEMFLLQLGVLRQKDAWEKQDSPSMSVSDSWLDQFRKNLPFELTGAQSRALEDVRKDMAAEHPMNRLLEGDVGSGKTAIAAAAIGMAAANNAQSAIMAPTSILAEQHFQTLSQLLPSACGVAPESIRLLTSGTPSDEKQTVLAGLARGQIQVVVGTHALLEDPIAFSDLGLAVIDEQHRFGVEQRGTLRSKGQNPNLLVMTATPIPRSLALTVYGDLDLSVIDELPPGRQPVETRVLSPIERSRAYSFIIGQLEDGHQAFVIYPLVEESDKLEAKAAVEEFEVLRKEVFFNYKVGLLHGRMGQQEKDEQMEAFRQGKLDVLVSTSVVEVGVDVPNATVVLVEGANHFGLAQLHQFRGRVGRSQFKSYCLLIPVSDEQRDNERLNAMERTNDGFELAEFDLEQRGPGDFLGTRQSGYGELRTAKLTDVKLIETARRQAHALFESDPSLSAPDHQLLMEAFDRFWSNGKGDIS